MALNKLSKYVKNSLIGICLASGLVGLESRLYAEIYVPRDYATIQAGIDASEDGDIVLVAPGVYEVNEPISFRGKGITLKSEESPKNTIINSNSPYTTGILRFENNENENSVLDGFTIIPVTGIRAGGVYCNNSSPIIKRNIIIGNIEGISCSGGSPQILNNIIINNTSFSNGGGIRCYDTNAVIKGNIVKDNYADEGGGGIFCRGDSSIIIEENYIIDNFAYEIGGGICLWGAEATIKNNVIAKNRSSVGGGISATYSIINIIRNTITDNTTEYEGGGIHFYSEPGFSGLLTAFNNIVWGNKGLNELWITGPSNISYNCLFQPEYCGINGNICADPLLVNPNPDHNTLDELIENGDFDEAMKYLTRCFSLQPNSPCIDAGDHEYLDPDGTRSDIGAIYFDRRDLYRDGFVDFKDYATLAGNWKKTGSGLEGDINNDEIVDYKDLKTLADNWLSIVPVYGGYD
jgi:hypothetical protein